MNADQVYAELLEGLLIDALRSQAEEKAFCLERERDARSALGKYKADGLEPLAQYICDNIEGEPSQSQGVVETSIRLLKKYKEDIEILQTQWEAANADALRWRDLYNSQSKELESLAAYLKEDFPNSTVFGKGTVQDALALLKIYREEEKERMEQEVKERLKHFEEDES